MKDSFWDKILELIQADQLEETLSKLESFLKGYEDKSNFHSVILNQVKLNRVKGDLIKGILEDREYRQERQKISYALIMLVDLLKSKYRNDLLPTLSSIKPENFKDGFGFEKILGDKSNLKKIAWLDLGLKKSKSICRIKNNLRNGMGTGFLSEKGYVYTNHHVLESVEDAEKAIFQFNFEEDSKGMLLNSYDYQADASTFQCDEGLDVCRVKLKTAEGLPDIESWKSITFSSVLPAVGDHVSIIQHPAGGPKQVALNENNVVNLDGNKIHYRTDTMVGSSGSPVFDDQWEVVAIHHAGGDMKKNSTGEMIYANEGILIRNILQLWGEL